MRPYPPILALSLLLAPASVQAYGETGENGLPSPGERALHFFTDELRVEPDFHDPQFGNYEPVRPLIYNFDLNDAARFHSDDMAENDCFQHASCDGTSFAERVARYYPSSLVGENIAFGYLSAWETVYSGWLYSDGHRENMLDSDWNELGTGFTPTGNGGLWVQDFGARGGVEEPIITSGTHWPLSADPGANLDFYLAVHDPEGTAPFSVEAMVDGACYEMEPDRGDGGSRTYQARAPVGDEGCIAYAFELIRSDGQAVTYPTTGVLLVPVGDSECSSWSDQVPPNECIDGSAWEEPGAGGCVGESQDGAMVSGSGQGCGSSGGPDDNVDQQNAEYGSCSVARGTAPTAGWLAAAGVPLLALRRRQRDR